MLKKKKKEIEINFDTDEVADNALDVQDEDNMYGDYVLKEEQKIENTDDIGEIAKYQARENTQKDNYLEKHTVLVEQSKNSRLLLIGFYILAIIIVIIVFLITFKR